VLARRIWTVFVGMWVGAWFARALFDWVLGIDGTWLLVAMVVAAAIGARAGWEEAKGLEPLTLWERRDAFLGWGALIGVAAVIACFFLPMPGGGIAAGAVAATTLVVLRRAPAAPPR
jgi:hypothetical protein